MFNPELNYPRARASQRLWLGLRLNLFYIRVGHLSLLCRVTVSWGRSKGMQGNVKGWILSLEAHGGVVVYILIQKKDGTLTEKYPGQKFCYHHTKISVSS